MQTIPERARERLREAVSTAPNAIEPAWRGRAVLRKLIDERDEREFFGVRQKKAAQPGGGGAQIGVGVHLIEPRRYGPPRQIRGDRRVPPLLGEGVRPADLAQFLLEPVPAARRVARDHFRAPAPIGPDVAEPALEDARQLEAALGGKLADLVLGFIDEIASCLGVLPLREAVPDGPDPSADAVSNVDHSDSGASCNEVACRRKPRQARSRHQHRHPAQRRIVHASTVRGNGRRMG